MNVTAVQVTPETLVRRACEVTLRSGKESKTPLHKLFQCEHSPIRALMFWVELEQIPTFVSVHLVRHKVGVEHYVMSNRPDRGGPGDGEVTRTSPINHAMLVNAAALISMSRKRLCLKSHAQTVGVWTKVRNAVADELPELADYMVPECVYRNGLCPELRPCKAGPKYVCTAYPRWGGVRDDREP